MATDRRERFTCKTVAWMLGPADTHWEFYGRVRGRGSAELAGRFRRLTGSYEATQYAYVLLKSDRLHDLLEDAGFVVEHVNDGCES